MDRKPNNGIFLVELGDPAFPFRKVLDKIRLYLQRLIVNGSLLNYMKPQDIFRKGDNTPQDGKLNTQPKKTKPLSKSANICYHFVSYFINQYFVAKI